jgi:hypothetical protein
MMLPAGTSFVSNCSALGGDIMTSQDYRSKALECLESAPWICDRSAKKALIDMALCWLRLADMHDANRDRADESDQVGTTRLAGLSS